MIMVLAAMIATSIPAFAADHAQNGHDAKCIKDCQMLVKNCGQEVDSIQQDIEAEPGNKQRKRCL